MKAHMNLVFGGAYQGKLDYAKEKYKINEDEVFNCGVKSEIDFKKKVIYKLEDFVMGCLKQNIEAKDYLEENREKWNETTFICTDISAGIVPYEKELRMWREMVGRTLVYLGKEAEEVTRLFCGIPQKIK